MLCPVQDVVRGEHHQVHGSEARPVHQPLRVIISHVRGHRDDREFSHFSLIEMTLCRGFDVSELASTVA